MGLKESLKKLQEDELKFQNLSLKREVKKELTKITMEKIKEKYCIMCNALANYSIKGSNDWYCKDCAIECFGDLKHLTKTKTTIPKKLLVSNKKFYFITGNKNKFSEVQAVFPNVKQLKVNLDEIQDFDARKIIEHKLLEATKKHKGEFIVEDTSLYMESMNGLPGPLIKWFLDRIGNDGLYQIADNNSNNKAVAKTIIGYYKRGKIHYFEGVVEGTIVRPRVKTTFGWDAIFVPDGYDITYGEMSREDKNAISMRRLALEKFREYLEK